MIEKRIGKIAMARVGHGGYQDAHFGVSFTLSSSRDSWGVADFWGAWSQMIKCDAHCKWTEEDRRRLLADVFMRLDRLLIDAKRANVSELVGVPVEVEFDGTILKSWRVLTEAV